jgi:hypothetical protein
MLLETEPSLPWVSDLTEKGVLSALFFSDLDWVSIKPRNTLIKNLEILFGKNLFGADSFKQSQN